LGNSCSGGAGTVCGLNFNTGTGAAYCQNCGGHNIDCCQGMACNPHTPPRTCQPNTHSVNTCQ
jgi:hypothetical protein